MSALPTGIRLFSHLHDGSPGLALWCPACRHIHHVPLGGDGGYSGAGRWHWDADTLTLMPSVKHFYPDRSGVEHITCHYFVKGGQVEFLDDTQGHAERGLHRLDEPPPEDYGGREHFGWGTP
jgi:hypothetical protein